MQNMTACKAYANDEIVDLLYEYNVLEYRGELAKKVNDICLEMGYECHNDKPKFERLAKVLQNNIYSISLDEEIRNKLFKYANRVMRIGRNYFDISS